MSTWLALGTGPSALAWRDVLAQSRARRVATSNGGLQFCPQPDVYFCVDAVASRQFAERARIAQVLGTQLVTLQRDPQALRERQLDFYDEFLELPGHDAPTATQMGRFERTGVTLLDYLTALRGATEVHLVGFDGYTGARDYPAGYEYGRSSTPERRAQDTAVLARLLAELARARRAVRFVHHGAAVFGVDAPNWEHRA